MLQLKVSDKNKQTVTNPTQIRESFELTYESWDEIQRIATGIERLDGQDELQSYGMAYLQFVLSGCLVNGFCTD